LASGPAWGLEGWKYQQLGCSALVGYLPGESLFSLRMKYPVLLLLALLSALTSHAQLPKPWLGTWSGTMSIQRQGAVVDSVPVRLTIAPRPEAGVWTWKTEYLSKTRPMTKDYLLRVKDAAKGLYITDEGEGVELTDYLFGNKFYSVFEVEGVLLTATYELRGDELIFEVTSGPTITRGAAGPVTNYPVNNLQRVVYRRAK